MIFTDINFGTVSFRVDFQRSSVFKVRLLWKVQRRKTHESQSNCPFHFQCNQRLCPICVESRMSNSKTGKILTKIIIHNDDWKLLNFLQSYNATNVTVAYSSVPINQLFLSGFYKAVVNISSRGQYFASGFGVAEIKTPLIWLKNWSDHVLHENMK